MASARVHAELGSGRRLRVGRKRVARLMRLAGPGMGVHHRRKRAAPADCPRPPTITCKRQFTADAPDRLWVTDITAAPHRRGMGLLLRPCSTCSAADRGLVDRGPPAHRARRRRAARWPAGDGNPTRHDRSRRPRTAIHVLALRASAARSRADGLDGQGRLRVRQRADRVVLVGRCRPSSSTAALGHHEPQLASAMFEWIEAFYNPSRRHSASAYSVPDRVRNPSHRRRHRGMITTPETVRKTGTGQ